MRRIKEWLKVAIVIGSKNDMEYLEGAKEILDEIGITL